MQSSLEPIPIASSPSQRGLTLPEATCGGPRSSFVWRLFYTLRYHRPSQLLRRLRKRALRPLPWRSESSLDSHLEPETRRADTFRQLYRDRSSTRFSPATTEAEILAGRWQFLGTTCDLGVPLRWAEVADLDVDHLWKFQAHYHEWLLDLRHDLDAGWELVRLWAETFCSPRDEGSVDAWHPFCISRRIPVWCMVWHTHPPSSLQVRHAILESLARQCGHLANHLELDLGGNHLLENLRALLLGAAFFSSEQAAAWKRLAEEHLYQELPRQILRSGEHFERAPMYHNLVLELLIDIRDVLRSPGASASDSSLADFVQSSIDRMAEFLSWMVHPDGEIPLLSDSALSLTPSSSGLLRRAGQAGPDRAAGSATIRGNYWSWNGSEGEFLLFDAGAAAADDLPAHGHCDLLGIEGSLFGRRFLIDAGVFDYGETAMRSYCRGSRAHNVMMVDDLDQCDVWSRFRMGYRGQSGPLEAGQDSGFSWARATHDAYRRVGVARVGRWVGCRPGLWVGLDWATAADGQRITNRLRIHPDFQLLDQPDPGQFVFSAGGQPVYLRWLWGEVVEEWGWYCPDFGVRQRVPVLCWSTDQKPYCSAWVISTKPLKPEVDVQLCQNRATVTYIPSNESLVVSL